MIQLVLSRPKSRAATKPNAATNAVYANEASSGRLIPAACAIRNEQR